MTTSPGTYTLGPQQAMLTVHTRKGGAAAKAGHDLVIEVGSWNAELQVGEDLSATTMSLDADSSSMRVLEGTGGLQKLGDDDKASIKTSIDTDVLKGGTIAFRSSGVEPGEDGGALRVRGELDLLGTRRPVGFELRITDDGEITGRATLLQSDFGIKPYSTLFGVLKVLDEIRIVLDGRLPSS